MQLTGEDLDAMAGAFGLSDLTSLDGYENAVYRAERPSRHVLRITHSTRRTPSQIGAEMTFLHALDDAGVSVAAPIEASDGRLAVTHEARNSGMVTAVAMPFAPGGHRSPSAWTDDDLQRYGRLIAEVHSVARDLATGPRLDRPNWDEVIHPVVEVDLGGRHPDVLERTIAVVDALRGHPAGQTTQLVHQDPHLGNLFITEDGAITLFDFDDSGYGSPTFDLAMVIFYWIAGRNDLDDAQAEVRRLLGPFLSAYQEVYPLEQDWVEGAELHMTLRELELYAALVDTDINEAGWDGAYMRNRRQRIDDGTPFLGSRLAELT